MPYILPKDFDPYDMALKLKINPKADEMNYILDTRKTATLACGCTRKGKLCKAIAGFGTDHVGYGRCKFHGGCNTGPKTPEGKAITAQNSTKHGLYRKALTEREKELFDELITEGVGVEAEIAMLKAKILSYLTRSAEKWQAEYAARIEKGWEPMKAEEQADIKTRVYYTVVSEGENGDERIGSRTHYYNAGSIEDKPLIRSLETLGRLVDKHAKLKGLDHTGAEDILEGINKELRAATHGQVSVSWGTGAQKRNKKTEE